MADLSLPSFGGSIPQPSQISYTNNGNLVAYGGLITGVASTGLSLYNMTKINKLEKEMEQVKLQSNQITLNQVETTIQDKTNMIIRDYRKKDQHTIKELETLLLKVHAKYNALIQNLKKNNVITETPKIPKKKNKKKIKTALKKKQKNKVRFEDEVERSESNSDNNSDVSQSDNENSDDEIDQILKSK